MTDMLPFDQGWYRRIVGFAVLLGIAGGILGLVYLGITGALADVFFDSGGVRPWSGEWWWIPFVAAGGLVVTLLHSVWRVPAKVPGGVELIERGEVDHTTAVKWVVIAAVSAVMGASLGPSFALVVMGGGLGSWIVSRRWAGTDDARSEYTLVGIAGGFGAAFTSPILGAFLVSEVGPTPKTRYVNAMIPQVIAASIGFVIFYAVAGRTFLGIYGVPAYDFRIVHMATAAVLGVLAAFVMVVFVLVNLAVQRVTRLVPNRYVLGVAGGALVGLLAFALPLSLGSGQSQLDTVVEQASGLGVALLVAVLLAKMLAMATSLAIGFMGGNVFPMIFMGGTAGVIVHLAVPGVPYALAVSCMLAAVPGSYLRAPISMTFIAAIAVALDPATIPPVAVAVIVSYFTAALLRYAISRRRPVGATEPRSP
jgi:H+/Cl- antiporter ClcA